MTDAATHEENMGQQTLLWQPFKWKVPIVRSVDYPKYDINSEKAPLQWFSDTARLTKASFYTKDQHWCSTPRDMFSFPFFHTSSLSKSGSKSATMLLKHRQLDQRFSCVMLVRPEAFSLQQRWRAGCRGLVSSLLSNSTHPDFLIFFGFSTCSLMPQSVLTLTDKVTSLECIYQTSHSTFTLKGVSMQ